MIDWKDVTSYRREERGKIAPQSWQARVSWLRIVVSRITDAAPDAWVLMVYPIQSEPVPLSSSDLAEAQREAIRTVCARLRAALSALEDT